MSRVPSKSPPTKEKHGDRHTSTTKACDGQPTKAPTTGKCTRAESKTRSTPGNAENDSNRKAQERVIRPTNPGNAENDSDPNSQERVSRPTNPSSGLNMKGGAGNLFYSFLCPHPPRTRAPKEETPKSHGMHKSAHRKRQRSASPTVPKVYTPAHEPSVDEAFAILRLSMEREEATGNDDNGNDRNIHPPTSKAASCVKPRYGPAPSCAHATEATSSDLSPEERHEECASALAVTTSIWKKMDETPTSDDALINPSSYGELVQIYRKRGRDFCRLAPDICINPATKHSRKLSKLGGKHYAANQVSFESEAADYNSDVPRLRHKRPRNRFFQ